MDYYSKRHGDDGAVPKFAFSHRFCWSSLQQRENFIKATLSATLPCSL